MTAHAAETYNCGHVVKIAPSKEYCKKNAYTVGRVPDQTRDIWKCYMFDALAKLCVDLFNGSVVRIGAVVVVVAVFCLIVRMFF